MKTKLLIVISSDNADTIMKFPLLYGGVSMPRGYWEEVHVMFWGASILRAVDTPSIRDKVISMQSDGVKFSACVVCAGEYEATQSLEAIGIACTHTGELLTQALKSDEWSVMTI
ncbi:MAG: DsrE family protein [Sulfuricurvum sp. PC08-66]|nr:MAG: DsrE family protein [Sulfuricurvum sp. PC08-66]